MIQAAIDTSCGTALAVKCGSEIVFSGRLDARGRRSDAELVPWLLEAVKTAGLALRDIRRWTVGTGPGSFSGIRVGIALVKGICEGTRAAVRGLPTSLALARAVASETEPDSTVGVLHDARRGQLILSEFRVASSGLIAVAEARAVDPAELTAEDPGRRFVTAQPAEVRPLLDDAAAARLTVLTGIDATLLLDPPGWPWPESHGEAEASAEPIYVRPPVFVKPRQHRVPPKP